MDYVFASIFVYLLTVYTYITICNRRDGLSYRRFHLDGIFIEEWCRDKPATYPLWWLPNIIVSYRR